MRLIVLLLSLLPLPALADAFGDCSDPTYFQTFGITAQKGACVVIDQESASVNGQPVAIRALRTKTTDPAWDNFGREAIDVALTAYATWEPYAAQLGLKFPTVSIYLSDPSASTIELPSEKFPNVWADAQGFARPGECFVRINSAKALTTSADHVQTIIGHELFHCVQAASFPDQLQTGGEASKWWVEGTASFFGNLAHLTEKDIDDLGTAFATQIQTKPLTRLPYASMTFFAFLWQDGPGTMAQFFAGLPTTTGEDAQMEAVLASIGPEKLQLFAQAMVDGTVAMPDGTHFPALPEPATTTFQSDGKVTFPSAPFTILQHALHFTAGNYSVGTGIEFFSKTQGSDAPWEPLPYDIAPEDCKDVTMLHIVRFDTDTIPSAVARPLNATRYLPCWECTKLPKMDQCLVGKWRLSNESLLSYLTTKNTPEATFRDVKGEIFLQLNADGSGQWVAEDVAIDATVIPKKTGPALQAFDILVEAFGIDEAEWSGTGGTANLCVASPGIDFTTTVSNTLIGSFTNQVTGMAQNMSVAYDCAGNTLALQYTGPMDLGADAPRWTLERVK
ncbi:MAG: hypothetical protein U1E58_01345 [Tabrizicola sp.]